MTSYDYPHQNLSNNPTSSLYCQYLQTQHQWISSIFATATSTLETNIMSNILKILEEDKTKSQNIMMITLCQLAQKIHCNGALLENVLSKNDDDEKYQHNLQHTLTLIKNQQNNKFQTIENELIVIKKNIKSNQNMLKHVSHQLDTFIIQNDASKKNDPYPQNIAKLMDKIDKMDKNPQNIEKLMDKIDKMDKKINIMKTKQLKSIKSNEQNINLVKQISIDNNEIKECMFKQSVTMQSVKHKLQTTISQQMSSLSNKITSIQTEITKSRASYQQISSLNTEIASIQTQLSSLSSLINKKSKPFKDSVSKNAFSETKMHQYVSKVDMPSGTNNKSNKSIKQTPKTPSHFDTKLRCQTATSNYGHPSKILPNQFTDTSTTQVCTNKTLDIDNNHKSYGNNKYHASPQIFSSNMADSRNNTSNKSTASKSIITSSTVTTAPANASTTTQFTVTLPHPPIISLTNNKPTQKPTEKPTQSTQMLPHSPMKLTTPYESPHAITSNKKNALSPPAITSNINKASSSPAITSNKNNNNNNNNILSDNRYLPSLSCGIYGSYLVASKKLQQPDTDSATLTPNTHTQIVTSAAQPKNDTQNTLQNVTKSPIINTKSTNNTFKSIPTSNTSSKSFVASPKLTTIPTNASITPGTFSVSSKDGACLSKKIKNEYFPTYNPTIPTLPLESKPLQSYYYEDEMDDGYLNPVYSGTEDINTWIMNLERYRHLHEYKINMNLKKLARNPFSATDITPPKHRMEQAIQYKEVGNKCYAEKQFESAIKYYRIAQRLDPTNAIYKLNESAATLMMKDFISTIHCCEEALLYTKDAKWKCKAYKRMGTAEERRGNISKSIAYYTKAQAEQFDAELKKKIKTICSKNI